MNKVYTFIFCAISAVAFTSCEKCSTCTTISEDPETLGETITDEICGRGRDYDDQLEIYTRSNWDCTEESN
jgi:hypothetical protein